MNSTNTRSAIVTGASSGIGAAVAKRLARDGFSVIVNYATAEKEAQAVVDEIKSVGGNALAVQADVSDPKAVADLFNAAQRAFTDLSVVVNNAGVMKLSPIADTEDSVFDQTIAINLKGVFNGMREAARRLPRGGRIISFSSSVVGVYLPTYGIYGATKAAVETMTPCCRRNLDPNRSM